MYVMTKEEVLQYFFARENFRRAELEATEIIENIYEDVAPTMSVYDSDSGKLYCKSSSVEIMALYIIAKKSKVQKHLKNVSYTLECFNEWLSILEPSEARLFILLKRNRKDREQLIEDARLNEAKAKLTEIAYLQHLRQEVLREVRNRQAEVKEVQIVREYYAEETRKNISMGKKHVFDGYHFQWLSDREIRQLKLDEEQKKIAEEKRKAEWEAFMSRRISNIVTDISAIGEV